MWGTLFIALYSIFFSYLLRTSPFFNLQNMEALDALKAFANLCAKMEQMIDASTTRIKTLEEKVRMLEDIGTVIYSQQQVANLTGWSVAAVNNWVKTGFIIGVPVRGRKNLGIPASEVKVILSKKGFGKNRQDNRRA